MLIDAHAHLDRYGAALDAAIAEIESDRIFTVATAMNVSSYRQALEIAARSNLVLPTFGIHPKNAPSYAHRLASVSKYIEASPALGEIGLDYHWVKDASRYAAQRKVLEYFFAAAREQNKFVNLHTKGAEKEILDLLEHYDIRRSIIHWYSGPLDILRALIQFGSYFTVGVEVLYSPRIQMIAQEVPDQLLLTETDNPGGLQWLKGIVGMPTHLRQVIEATARLKAKSVVAMAKTVRQNFLRLIQDDAGFASLRRLLGQTTEA
jgi:TatD DNase family protein